MQQALEAEGHHFVRLTPPTAEAVSGCVAQAIEAGARQILVVGGDGTHHHAINGLMQQRACSPASLKYALFPSGTGNDWVRTHRIPSQPQRWLDLFRAQTFAHQDLGLIEAVGSHGKPMRRYFANVVGLGYDAEVVRYLAHQQIASTGGWKYFRAIYQCLKDYQPVPLRVEVEGKMWEKAFYTLNAGICRYSGGGMRFVPQANPRDGQLAYTLIDEVPGWRVAINTPWLYTPWFDRHPLATAGQTPTLRISHLGQRPCLIEADGELIGQTPASLRVVRAVLQFLSPPVPPNPRLRGSL
jgi:diacylglycerol kinase family enzyme